MCTVCVECVKDVVFISGGVYLSDFYWSLMTCVDMVAVPMYAFILMELVSPGYVSRRLMLLHEAPFVLLPVLFFVSRSDVFYYMLVAWAAVYGTFYLVWTAVKIPRYNRQLKERFSYTENVNLGWLRVILYTFYVILALWIFDCVVVHLNVECIYMLGSLVLWMIIDYFIYKHESVLDELTEVPSERCNGLDAGAESSELSRQITALFMEGQAFLNPHLKVSDVAMAVGTNRTYVSNYFNREAGSSFYDYVNGLRVEYACKLLVSTGESVKCVAEKSGFNSPQSFIRVFIRLKGVTPTAFRVSGQSAIE